MASCLSPRAYDRLRKEEDGFRGGGGNIPHAFYTHRSSATRNFARDYAGLSHLSSRNHQVLISGQGSVSDHDSVRSLVLNQCALLGARIRGSRSCSPTSSPLHDSRELCKADVLHHPSAELLGLRDDIFSSVLLPISLSSTHTRRAFPMDDFRWLHDSCACRDWCFNFKGSKKNFLCWTCFRSLPVITGPLS